MLIVLRRLQGLNIEAGPEDIREFFHDLRIPQGAVHILGGDLAEAFILFTSERDGQLAMGRSGNVLKGSRVTLHNSSLAEWMHKLALRLKQYSTKYKDCPETQAVYSPEQPCEKVNPLSSSQQDAATLLLTLLKVVQEMESIKPATDIEEDRNSDRPLINLNMTQINHSLPALSPPLAMAKNEKEAKEQLISEAVACNPGYLRLYGLPETVTEADISHFLHELCVQEVLMNVCLGDRRRGCLAKIASEEEVEVGLQRNGQSFGTFSVEVRKATVKQWNYAIMKPQGSPEQIQTSESEIHMEQQEKSISTRKRHFSRDQFSKTCKEKREEFCIMVRNLRPNMNKTEIKCLLRCPHLHNYKIQHLLDKNLRRTSTAFVAFDRVEDYASAIDLSGSRFGKLVLDVSPITREKMMSQVCSVAKSKRQQSGVSKTCVYVRNLPADVSQVQVRAIFHQFPVEEEDITLLRDGQGHGLGEVVVSFGSEGTAREAHSLHRGNFMGNEILLTLITPQQLDNMLSGQSVKD